MIEKEIFRSGRKVIEVRSDGGKLLYIKTPEGYEMKCPRTKRICLVRYEEMLSDCVKCLEHLEDKDLKQILVSRQLQLKG